MMQTIFRILTLVVATRALSPTKRVARALFGDPTKAPLRNAVRAKLREATFNMAPTAVVDAAVRDGARGPRGPTQGSLQGSGPCTLCRVVGS